MELKLHPKQGEAFLTSATEVLFGGAAGGGKSHLLRVAAIAWCAAVPGLQVYLFRRTYPDLYKNHIDGPGGFPALLAPWLACGAVRLNYSKGHITFCNGAKIHLSHCQYPKDLLAYQGAEIHVLMIDELTQWPWDMYAFLRGRLRLGGLDLPAERRGRFPRILACANPGGIGHTAVKAAFVEPAPAGRIFRVGGGDGGMRRQYIPARLEDNPTLLRNDPDYEARLQGLGNPALIKAMRHGDWDIVAGGMFDDLWDPAFHILPPFVIPNGWRVDRSFDWGSSRPFSVGWWAQSDGSDACLPDGQLRPTCRGDLFRIAEWYGWNGKANEGGRLLARDVARGILEREEILARSIGFGGASSARPGPADSAIFAVENGNAIADDMAAAGVHWERADKSPGSRKLGWEKLRALLKGAREPDQPGLYIFETCRHFIRTVPVLPRDATDPDDVDTRAEDHVADETRYRITAPRRPMKRTKLGGL